jgi:hypothetical protein
MLDKHVALSSCIILLTVFEFSFGVDYLSNQRFHTVYGWICAGCWVAMHLYFGIKVWVVLCKRKAAIRRRKLLKLADQDRRASLYNHRFDLLGRLQSSVSISATKRPAASSRHSRALSNAQEEAKGCHEMACTSTPQDEPSLTLPGGGEMQDEAQPQHERQPEGGITRQGSSALSGQL